MGNYLANSKSAEEASFQEMKKIFVLSHAPFDFPDMVRAAGFQDQDHLRESDGNIPCRPFVDDMEDVGLILSNKGGEFCKPSWNVP